MKCKYYIEQGGYCDGMKCAPRVSCGGNELKCECKNNTEFNYYDLVSEIVFQIKITDKDKAVEKVYCKSREDVNLYINTVLSKRDLTRIQNIQIAPIKNLYYKKR